MNNKNNSNLTKYSQILRREMTKEERRLWYDFLKELPVTVNRQKVVGKYILDFYIASSKLAIELDGSQHYSVAGAYNDSKRAEYLSKLGITVLRFSNLDVMHNFAGVCEVILEFIEDNSDAGFPPGEAK